MTEPLPLPPELRLARYRIALAPEARLTLPPNPGAMLRGALGLALKRGVCGQPTGRLCGQKCELPDICPYAFLWESPTPPGSEVLSASQEVPPPYLLEPPLAPPAVIEPGAQLVFGLTLFGKAVRYFPYLLGACRSMGQTGLGRARVRCRLAAGSWLPPDGRETPLFDPTTQRMIGSQPLAPAAVDWAAAPPAQVDQVTVRFLTPTRLKVGSSLERKGYFTEDPPPFHVLIRALLRRVSSLSYFYGGQRWELDYRGWIARAEAVQISHADVRWVDRERYSTRQQRAMNLGGIVGEVTYTAEERRSGGTEEERSGGAGEQGNGAMHQSTNLPDANVPSLGAFLPLLRLGELVHVGKAAVFGNGRFEVTG